MKTQQSMLFGDDYIEDLIEGYTTISVEGRDTLDISYESETVGNRDGSIYKRKKYDSRTLTVSFVIEGTTREELLYKEQQLNGILNRNDEVEIRVDDEPDLFYKGTRVGSANFAVAEFVSSGKGVATGTFDIFCADPFKYSDEIDVVGFPDPDTGGVFFDFDYNGTVKTYPVFETQFYSKIPASIYDTQYDPEDVKEQNPITGFDDTSITGYENESLHGAGECTYVAFYNDKEKIVQLGNPDAVAVSQSSDYPQSQALINQEFKTIEAWVTGSQQNNWIVNQNAYNLDSTKYLFNGSLGMAAPVYETPSVTTSGTLLGKTISSDGTKPRPHYTFTYSAGSRTADSVKITVTVKAAMPSSGNNMAKKNKLTAVIQINGSDFTSISLKNSSTVWKKKKTYTASGSFTVNVDATTEIIKNVKVRVDASAKNTCGKLSNRSASNIVIPNYISLDKTGYYLAPNYGISQNNKAAGPMMTKVLPADMASVTGAKDFDCTWNLMMCIGKGTNDPQQMGIFQALMVTEVNGTKKLLAGITIEKTSAGSQCKITKHWMDAGGSIMSVTKTGVDISYNNAYFGSSSTSTRACSIKKEGDTISFLIGGINLGDVNTNANYEAKHLQFGFFKYSGYPTLSFMGIFGTKFTKNNCTQSVDVDNPFSSAGILIADSNNAEITLDGNRRPDLGALGNDWEDIAIVPGHNIYGGSFGLLEYDDGEIPKVLRHSYLTEPYDDTIRYYDSVGIEVPVTEAQYYLNPVAYFRKESVAPKFIIHYREVYV